MTSDTGTLGHEDDLIPTDSTDREPSGWYAIRVILGALALVAGIVFASHTFHTHFIAPLFLEGVNGIGPRLALVQNEKEARPALDTAIVDVTGALEELRAENGRYPLTLGPDARQPTLDVTLPAGVSVIGYVVSPDGAAFAVTVSRNIAPDGVTVRGRSTTAVTYDSTTGQTVRSPGVTLKGDQ